MRVGFRALLMVTLLSLLLGTVLVVSFSSYKHARFTAEDLSRQGLEQAALRVDERIRILLGIASTVSAAHVREISEGRLDLKDFPGLSRTFVQTMELHPALTYLSANLDENGETLIVSRLHDGTLSIRELRRSPTTHKLELSDYYPSEYPRFPYYFDPDRDAGDPRRRPWYADMKRKLHSSWTETYVFLGVDGVADVPGVTYATPLFERGEGGRLVAGLTADFDLFALSEYLGTVRIAETGFGFVVEERADGMRRVIAHPDPSILMRDVRKQVVVHELVEVDRLADARVRAFLAHIPHVGGGRTLTPVSFDVAGRRYIGGFLRLREGHPHWIICTIVPESEMMGRVARSTLLTVAIAVVSLSIALLISIVGASWVARPLAELARQAEDVGAFRLEGRPPARSRIKEIAELGAAMEGMRVGLRSFRKFVPAELVRTLLASGEEARIGGHKAVLTLFFSDIAGFMSATEMLNPEALVAQLCEYQSAVNAELNETGGTLDKYIGDAIMAFWGAPKPNRDQAFWACLAALGCQARLAELRKIWCAQGKPEFHTRIGLHTGEVIVGNMGSATRLNYTAIGDAVNLASRLEGLNRYYGTAIMLSETTYAAVADRVVARPLDRVAVKGKQGGLLIFELLGLEGLVAPDTLRFVRTYTAALDAYFERRFDEALEGFDAALALRAGDLASQKMKERAESYRAHPPGPDWDGVYKMESK